MHWKKQPVLLYDKPAPRLFTHLATCLLDGHAMDYQAARSQWKGQGSFYSRTIYVQVDLNTALIQGK